MTKYVYNFAEGDKTMEDLLGATGANLSTMTRLGLPVPPGFIITTGACREFLGTGTFPPALRDEITQHLGQLEETTGQRLGDPEDPLLVSVGTGARLSVPATMGTFLGAGVESLRVNDLNDIGLDDESVVGLTKQSGDERFAWDCYRRLIEAFAQMVMGVDGELFERARTGATTERDDGADVDLDVPRLKELVSIYLDLVERETGYAWVTSPRAQLFAAIAALFRSGDAERPCGYARQEVRQNNLGVAVNVAKMTFGNLGLHSGTGMAFSRDPATGNHRVCGDYSQGAQGRDAVAGARNPMPLEELEHLDDKAYSQLLHIMAALEYYYGDLCQVEFAIERGHLWVLRASAGHGAAR